MFYYFSIIPLYVIIHLFLIHISNSFSSGEDKMLIAFVRNDQKMQISEYSEQKYEDYFGNVYFMRKNWQCDKMADQFEENERTECQKYQKYFGILYEYLSSEYVEIPTVKPKFAFKNSTFEIEGPIIYAINCLTKIFFRFYFNKGRRSNYYDSYFEPKLLNEHRLNVGVKIENKESKLPINEMILQLAIDTANEWQTNESLNGIIRQNFDKNMKELFKKAEERANEVEEEEEYFDVNTINKNENAFDDSMKWTDDALFTGFVKGHVTTDLQKFSKCFINKNSQFEEHLKKYEAHLCAVYFIKNNWHQCEAICEDNLNYCLKYRKYLHIFYEYLFQLYAQAKSPNDSIQLSPVRPIFVGAIGFALSLIEVISNFNFVAKYSCDKAYDWATKWNPMELVNEVELNYDENNKQDLQESTDLSESTKAEKIIRKEFEQKMKKICEGKSGQLEETHWFIG